MRLRPYIVNQTLVKKAEVNKCTTYNVQYL